MKEEEEVKYELEAYESDEFEGYLIKRNGILIRTELFKKGSWWMDEAE